MGNYDQNRITVSAATDSIGRVAVKIADTGTGIPEDVRARMFTPFFTTKPVGVGTGLGLAISHRIITNLGGTIEFVSEVGRGTEFIVTLPVAKSPALQRASQRIDLPPPVRRGKVLVIDDEETLGAAIKRYLTHDHDVVAVTSAGAALELFGVGEEYDVILCDLMMPQMTGMELFAEMQAKFPELAEKIIFLTGGAFTASAREFLASTTTRHLEKPFDLQALRKLINTLVR